MRKPNTMIYMRNKRHYNFMHFCRHAAHRSFTDCLLLLEFVLSILYSEAFRANQHALWYNLRYFFCPFSSPTDHSGPVLLCGTGIQLGFVQLINKLVVI